MSSGKEHDKATLIISVPFGVGVGLFLGADLGILGGLSFLVGGLWLSPDLDTHSNSLKRWGFLKWMWWPYRKSIKHRSIFSHGPFVGTVLRTTYLITWLILMLATLKLLGIIELIPIVQKLTNLIKNNPIQIFTVILGFESSAMLHLIKDGDPWLLK